MFKLTSQHRRYWANRKIDWRQAYGDNPEAFLHPHRRLIVEKLNGWRFGSVCEVGCAAGANLILIKKCFPNVEVGGADVNADAIATAKALLPMAILDVRPASDLYFSDKCADVALSDAVMIYHGPKEVRRAVREMKRVSRGRAMFVEFHSTSWLKRVALWLATGYNAYDWRKLLLSEDFHDVEIVKIPAAAWPGTPWEQWGYLITARV